MDQQITRIKHRARIAKREDGLWHVTIVDDTSIFAHAELSDAFVSAELVWRMQ